MLIALIKIVPAPALFIWGLLGAAQLPGAGTISALVAIAFVLAGVFMFGTLKTRADEAERLMRLAREEASIEREKAERLESENVRLRAQPDLKEHAGLLRAQTVLIEKLTQSVTGHDERSAEQGREQIQLLKDIRTATVPPA